MSHTSAKVRNWHKRNVRSAAQTEARLTVASSPKAEHYDAYVQVRLTDDTGRKMMITMTPEQAGKLEDMLSYHVDQRLRRDA